MKRDKGEGKRDKGKVSIWIPAYCMQGCGIRIRVKGIKWFFVVFVGNGVDNRVRDMRYENYLPRRDNNKDLTG